MHRALVEVIGGPPPFKREMFEHYASGTHAGRATRKSPTPLPPLFAVELLQIAKGFVLALGFAGLHVGQEFDRDWIVRVAQFLDPLLQDVHVAKVAESPEEFLPSLPHLFPGGIGIHGHQAIGEKTAAADCHSQIVNRISVETRGRAFTLYQYSLHPGA